MMQNPFTYGNPISDPNRFYGREREIDQVFSRLKNIEFESSSIVGERRVGKTSLLKYLSHPKVLQVQGFNQEKYHFIYVDLQMVNPNTTPSRLWKHLLQRIENQCRSNIIQQLIETIKAGEEIETFTLSDLFSTIDGLDNKIIFLFDEFDNITKNKNFDSDFFYGLRSLAIHHPLALITSSKRELIELTHSEAIRSSPFFNIFANINVGLFSEEEFQVFLKKSLHGTGVSFTDHEKETIKQVAGTHPYFLQVACYFLFQAYAENLNEGQRIIFIKKEFFDEASPHLQDYWYTSNDQEKIVLTILTLLERNGKAADRAFDRDQLNKYYARSGNTLSHLEKRSLVINYLFKYELFNEAFGEWIFREITNVSSDQSFDQWLDENKGVMDRLTSKAKNELQEILPQIASNYRNLLISWLSDPKNLIAAAGLLKAVL